MEGSEKRSDNDTIRENEKGWGGGGGGGGGGEVKKKENKIQ
jgi:hypothetical protein